MELFCAPSLNACTCIHSCPTSLSHSHSYAHVQEQTGDIRSLVSDIYQIVLCTQPALKYDSDEFQPYRRTLKRYLLAYNVLIYKDMRDDGSLADLERRHLLSPMEISLLEDSKSYRCLMVTAWIYRLVTRMEQGDKLFIEVNPIKSQLTNRIFELRRLTNNMFTHVNKQLPYPFVHLLAMVTEMTLFVNAVSVGLQYGGSIGPCITQSQGRRSTDGDYVDCHDPWEMGMVVSVGALTTVLLPFLYIGLLSIGTMLEDPMGADASDEPAIYNHFSLQTALNDIDSAHDNMADENFLSDALGYSTSSPIIDMAMKAKDAQGKVTSIRHAQHTNSAETV